MNKLNKLTKTWLFISVPLSLLGAYFLLIVLLPEGHPHPIYDFGGKINWAELPQLVETNAPPLSMQDAVRLAREEVQKSGPPNGTWVLHSVGLGAFGGERSSYDLVFTDATGKNRTELVRVLLDGRAARMRWTNERPQENRH